MTSLVNLIDEACEGNDEAYEALVTCFAYKIDQEGKPIDAKFLSQMIDELEVNTRKGNTYAMVLLGNAYLNGWSVERSIAKALDYARRAASLGNAGGEVLLGFMYLQGYGVVKNYERAMSWFKSAAEKGHSTAVNNMGYMYEQGFTVKKDMAIALKYYQQAAKLKNHLAIKNLERLTGKKVES